MLTKSGFMVGLGETQDELFDVMRDLRAHGCDIVTIGQYLRPTMQHLPVERYYDPSEYEAFRELRPRARLHARRSRARSCARRTTPRSSRAGSACRSAGRDVIPLREVSRG